MKSIEKLSLSELESLLLAAEKRKALISRRRPPSVVRNELIALAQSYGYAIHEIFDVSDVPRVAARRIRTQKQGKVSAKYRDPENKRNTWSGRGQMPRWLADKVRRGARVADYLIPGLARPTVKDVRSIGRRTVYKAEVHSGRSSSDPIKGR
ncbi:H-NS family nucleoid-associated regulatory protein [Luteimonas huabeiensis]|uniref:H-NS histone family protein n=1 Tax=Luteimonas huabeiensis TaxID=1244513 RepID=UPI0009DD4FC9|nr:H-NS histone family protein [Luteimonas huabeiensis]